MGIFSNMLNKSGYNEVSRQAVEGANLEMIKSASIVDRQGNYGAFRTLDLQMKDGRNLSGVLSPKCATASGSIDLAKNRIFLTVVSKGDDASKIERWVVE